jgi:phosphoglycolate phosphatase
MTGLRAPSTVLFDLDGTFADTLPDLGGALAEALAERGLPPVSDETLRPLVSQGARAMAERACGERLDEDTLDAVVARFLALYGENVSRRTRLVDGMAPLLDALDGRRIPWGIVTNKRREYTDPLMKALDPDERAACIVSGDTTANAKPHPQPLLHACRLAGSRPLECVYVGDAQKDVVAARRAGMRCVAALYGYIAADDDPRNWHADATIDTPGDLLVWIDSL